MCDDVPIEQKIRLQMFMNWYFQFGLLALSPCPLSLTLSLSHINLHMISSKVL